MADPKPRNYQKVILKQGIPVGMLGIGDRGSVLAFKRAIDHGVNLSSIISRLFAPDFKLKEWLDKQGVPVPILGVSREGAVEAKKVAYADRGPRSAILSLQTLAEAVLIPLEPAGDEGYAWGDLSESDESGDNRSPGRDDANDQ